MRKLYGFLFIAVLSAVLAVNCKDPSSPGDSSKSQVSITIDPPNAEVARGGTQRFTAQVEGAAQTVKWTVSKNISPQTGILPSSGILTVDANETATELTVTATSMPGGTTSASVTVRVKGTSITISPKNVAVKQGGTQQFTAHVAGDSNNAVTWAVTGSKSSISSNGLLTVGAGEDLGIQLTVTAVSVADNTKSDSATVTVTDRDPDKVWLVGIPDWTFPPGTSMTKESDGIFTWKGDVKADDHFRFSLIDTTSWGDIWNGNWYAPDTNGKEAVLGDNAITYYPTDKNPGATEATGNAWKISAAGSYIITLDLKAAKMTLAKPDLTGVTITGPSGVEPGSKANKYTAAVTGGTSGQTVTWTWSVTPSNKPGTTINKDGTLTVDGDETPGTKLTITARASTGTGQPGTKTVTVIKAGSSVLPAVSKPALSDAGAAAWSYAAADDAKVRGYDVQLYKGTTQSGTPVRVNKGTKTYDFRSAIQDSGAGSYTVTVTAVGDDNTYYTSEESVKSDAKAFTRRINVTNIWWFKSGVARWVNPDSFGDYTIQLKKQTGGAGDFVNVGDAKSAERNPTVNPGNAAETVTDYDFVSAGVLGNSSMDIRDLYSFEVVALGDNKLVLDSVPAVSNPRMYSIFGDAKIWTIAEGGSGTNKRYVAGADNGKIAYSADGFTWTMSNQNVFGSTQAVRGIAHNGGTGSGRFVAVGYDGKIASSDDGGATWASRDSKVTTSLLSIAYGSNKFVAGGDGGNVRQSSDGITWENLTTYYNDKNYILDGQSVISIAYGDGKFIAGGSGATINFSPDGVDWKFCINLHGDDKSTGVKGIAFGNGTFVVALENNPAVSVCPSGGITADTWNGGWKPLDLSSPVESVSFGSNTFLAVGDNGKASKSTDNGASWTLISADTQFAAGEAITSSILLSNGRWLLAGWGKMAIITP